MLGFTGPLLAPLLRRRYIGRLRIFAHPLVAFPVWAINFYAWHTPFLYQTALRHDFIHALQHASFLAFGMAMWMALLGPLPKPAWFGNAARLVYIIAVRLAGTILANIMIFSGTVLYPIYRATDAKWHISPMGDQIAAAGVMMVEESLLTIGLFCWLFLKVAREAEERQTLLDCRRRPGPRARRAAGCARGGGGARRRAARADPGARWRDHGVVVPRRQPSGAPPPRPHPATPLRAPANPRRPTPHHPAPAHAPPPRAGPRPTTPRRPTPHHPAPPGMHSATLDRARAGRDALCMWGMRSAPRPRLNRSSDALCRSPRRRPLRSDRPRPRGRTARYARRPR